MRSVIVFAVIAFLSFSFSSRLQAGALYEPRGIGGGGAMAAFSISPYSQLRFVGTDMGSLYRSLDDGKTWAPISQRQVHFGSNLDFASDVGFSSDGHTVFFAEEGRSPKRSGDRGITWTAMDIPLHAQERIKYWVGLPGKPAFMLCATTEGVLVSDDSGDSWARTLDVDGDSKGTWIDQKNQRIFHAVPSAILASSDGGKTFKKWYTPQGAVKIRSFTAGGDANATTFAFIDSQGAEACSWARDAADSSDEQKRANEEDCGFVWVRQGDASGDFKNTRQEGGRFIRMAANDPKTIYVTGGNWVRQYGNKVWVSRDSGKSFKLRFQVYDWDQHPYRPWPSDRLEYSAVGLDVGWDDNLFTSFEVNPSNSSEAGGTGFYFLHATQDYGDHWLAPFTHFADTGSRAKGKKWSSTGLEVTSVLRLKFNPKQSDFGFASVCDLGGLVTEDGGKTWRISKAKYNTNYDYAFDPASLDRVLAASGNQHDFPLNFNTPLGGAGGIFETDDRGRHWKRLTPDTQEWNRQFLSVAYDPVHHIIYGGTEGAGIAKSTDGGKHWEFFNPGLPKAPLVIPQIEVDPRDGTVYALLTGDAPDFKLAQETGIYRYDQGALAWRLLRGKVNRPADVDPQYQLWLFPSAFAVDYKSGTLWLTDIENKGEWLATGAWKSTDAGRTWTRSVQVTHPTAVTIDPAKPNDVFISASNDVSGKWGNGGALYTINGGSSWSENKDLPFESSLFSSTPDPKRPGKGFFLFFGGGMLYGPWPGEAKARIAKDY